MHAFAADAAPHQEGLSTASDGLLVAMILAYAIALFLFAIEAAYGRRVPLRNDRLVPVGAGVSADGEVDTGGAKEPRGDTEEHAGGQAAAEDGSRGGYSVLGGDLDVGAGGPGDDLTVNVRHTEPEARASRHVVGMVALAVTAVGFLLNVAQVATRGLAADRWPWGNMFEFVIAISLCAVAAFLFAAIRYQARYLGTFVLVPVVLLLGIAVKWLYNEAGPLVPALDSYWIAIHVSAAIMATGGFLVSGAAGITYLLSYRTELRRAAGERVAGIAAKLPSPDLLDRVSHRFILFAFPIWTFAIIAGAVWADEAWGRFWGWDPKEVWSFITWVVYAAYLHARLTGGWRGSKATWIGLVGMACLLFNFFGVNYVFSGLHSYA